MITTDKEAKEVRSQGSVSSDPIPELFQIVFEKYRAPKSHYILMFTFMKTLDRACVNENSNYKTKTNWNLFGNDRHQ